MRERLHAVDQRLHAVDHACSTQERRPKSLCRSSSTAAPTGPEGRADGMTCRRRALRDSVVVRTPHTRAQARGVCVRGAFVPSSVMLRLQSQRRRPGRSRSDAGAGGALQHAGERRAHAAAGCHAACDGRQHIAEKMPARADDDTSRCRLRHASTAGCCVRVPPAQRAAASHCGAAAVGVSAASANSSWRTPHHRCCSAAMRRAFCCCYCKPAWRKRDARMSATCCAYCSAVLN